MGIVVYQNSITGKIYLNIQNTLCVVVYLQFVGQKCKESANYYSCLINVL